VVSPKPAKCEAKKFWNFLASHFDPIRLEMLGFRMSGGKKLDRSQVFSDILGGLNNSLLDSNPASVALDLIDFNPNQPRRYFDEEAHQSLSASVRKRGVLQPVILRPIGDRYLVIAGERRTRAAREAGLTEIAAVVMDVNETEAYEIATLENLAREDLNPLEETEAVLNLLEMRLEQPRDRIVWLLRQIYYESKGSTFAVVIPERERGVIDSVFAAVARFSPASFVTNRLPLLKLPEDLLEAINLGRLPFSSIKPLAAVTDRAMRTELLEEAIRNKLNKAEVTELVRERTASKPPPKRVLEIRSRLSIVQRQVKGVDAKKATLISKLIDEIEAILAVD
jgi:ParB family transcriptional regulator, chromosome partitioning protein